MGKPRVNLEDFSDMLHFDTEQEKAVTDTPAAASAQGEVPEPTGILEMDFARMESFPNHKFKLYEGQQLADMVESIRQFGVLLPIILWHNEDGKYIILSALLSEIRMRNLHRLLRNFSPCIPQG